MKIVPCNGLQAVAYTDGRNVLLRSQMDIDAVATVIHRGKGNENVYSMQWSPVDKLPLLAVMTCNEGNTKKIGKNEEDCCCVYVYRVAIRPFNSSGTKTETDKDSFKVTMFSAFTFSQRFLPTVGFYLPKNPWREIALFLTMHSSSEYHLYPLVEVDYAVTPVSYVATTSSQPCLVIRPSIKNCSINSAIWLSGSSAKRQLLLNCTGLFCIIEWPNLQTAFSDFKLHNIPYSGPALHSIYPVKFDCLNDVEKFSFVCINSDSITSVPMAISSDDLVATSTNTLSIPSRKDSITVTTPDGNSHSITPTNALSTPTSVLPKQRRRSVIKSADSNSSHYADGSFSTALPPRPPKMDTNSSPIYATPSPLASFFESLKSPGSNSGSITSYFTGASSVTPPYSPSSNKSLPKIKENGPSPTGSDQKEGALLSEFVTNEADKLTPNSSKLKKRGSRVSFSSSVQQLIDFAGDEVTDNAASDIKFKSDLKSKSSASPLKRRISFSVLQPLDISSDNRITNPIFSPTEASLLQSSLSPSDININTLLRRASDSTEDKATLRSPPPMKVRSPPPQKSASTLSSSDDDDDGLVAVAKKSSRARSPPPNFSHKETNTASKIQKKRSKNRLHSPPPTSEEDTTERSSSTERRAAKNITIRRGSRDKVRSPPAPVPAEESSERGHFNYSELHLRDHVSSSSESHLKGNHRIRSPPPPEPLEDLKEGQHCHFTLHHSNDNSEPPVPVHIPPVSPVLSRSSSLAKIHGLKSESRRVSFSNMDSSALVKKLEEQTSSSEKRIEIDTRVDSRRSSFASHVSKPISRRVSFSNNDSNSLLIDQLRTSEKTHERIKSPPPPEPSEDLKEGQECHFSQHHADKSEDVPVLHVPPKSPVLSRTSSLTKLHGVKPESRRVSFNNFNGAPIVVEASSKSSSRRVSFSNDSSAALVNVSESKLHERIKSPPPPEPLEDIKEGEHCHFSQHHIESSIVQAPEIHVPPVSPSMSRSSSLAKLHGLKSENRRVSFSNLSSFPLVIECKPEINISETSTKCDKASPLAANASGSSSGMMLKSLLPTTDEIKSPNLLSVSYAPAGSKLSKSPDIKRRVSFSDSKPDVSPVDNQKYSLSAPLSSSSKTLIRSPESDSPNDKPRVTSLDSNSGNSSRRSSLGAKSPLDKVVERRVSFSNFLVSMDSGQEASTSNLSTPNGAATILSTATSTNNSRRSSGAGLDAVVEKRVSFVAEPLIVDEHHHRVTFLSPIPRKYSHTKSLSEGSPSNKTSFRSFSTTDLLSPAAGTTPNKKKLVRRVSFSAAVSELVAFAGATPVGKVSPSSKASRRISFSVIHPLTTDDALHHDPNGSIPSHSILHITPDSEFKPDEKKSPSSLKLTPKMKPSCVESNFLSISPSFSPTGGTPLGTPINANIRDSDSQFQKRGSKGRTSDFGEFNRRVSFSSMRPAVIPVEDKDKDDGKVVSIIDEADKISSLNSIEEIPYIKPKASPTKSEILFATAAQKDIETHSSVSSLAIIIGSSKSYRVEMISKHVCSEVKNCNLSAYEATSGTLALGSTTSPWIEVFNCDSNRIYSVCNIMLSKFNINARARGISFASPSDLNILFGTKESSCNFMSMVLDVDLSLGRFSLPIFKVPSVTEPNSKSVAILQEESPKPPANLVQAPLESKNLTNQLLDAIVRLENKITSLEGGLSNLTIELTQRLTRVEYNLLELKEKKK